MLLMRKFKVGNIDIGRKFKDKNDFLWEFSISNLGLIDILKMKWIISSSIRQLQSCFGKFIILSFIEVPNVGLQIIKGINKNSLGLIKSLNINKIRIVQIHVSNRIDNLLSFFILSIYLLLRLCTLFNLLILSWSCLLSFLSFCHSYFNFWILSNIIRLLFF